MAKFVSAFPLFCSLLLVTGAASAQDQPGSQNGDPPKKESAGKRAGEIVTQPVRDVGIEKTKIPPILEAAAESPYRAPKGKGCPAITGELAQLNDALGPDFGVGTKENEDKTGKIASAGGSWVVNSLIPFRGLVREVSGAAPAERRLNAAITAGAARRGYLRGLSESRGCSRKK